MKFKRIFSRKAIAHGLSPCFSSCPPGTVAKKNRRGFRRSLEFLRAFRLRANLSSAGAVREPVVAKKEKAGSAKGRIAPPAYKPSGAEILAAYSRVFKIGSAC